MMNSQDTDKKVRKRTALLFAPLVVVPLLTLGFRALGGGGGEKADTAPARAGLNHRLPAARLKNEEQKSKLSFYEVIGADSLGGQLWRDPATAADSPLYRPPGGLLPEGYGDYPPAGNGYAGSAEESVYRRLEELQGTLGRDAVASPRAEPSGRPGARRGAAPQESRPEPFGRPSGSDPELQQLDAMMDKILDIQHPARVQERLTARSVVPGGGVQRVGVQGPLTTISLLDSTGALPAAGKDSAAPPSGNALIEAAIYGEVTVRDGSVVRLRLLTPLTVAGVVVPAHHFVYGQARFAGERLLVEVRSIRYREGLHPVHLEVRDLDGLPGLALKDFPAAEVAGRSLENASGTLDIYGGEPSLKGRLAAEGVGAVKSLLRRKTRSPKAVLKAGYRVWLYDRSRH